MSLPIFHTTDKDLSLLQTQWASQLDPKIACPLLNGIMIDSVALVTGDNVVSHRLNRLPLGYLIISQRGVFQGVVETSRSVKSLVLNAAGSTTVDLYIF